MIDRVAVDFKRTFGQAVFMGVEPKLVRAVKDDPTSPQVQARDKATNTPKWTVTLAVQYKSFERTKSDTMTVTVTALVEPCGGFILGQVVGLQGCEMGVMKQERSGFSLFWEAASIIPLALQQNGQNGAARPQGAPVPQ